MTMRSDDAKTMMRSTTTTTMKTTTSMSMTMTSTTSTSITSTTITTTTDDDGHEEHEHHHHHHHADDVFASWGSETPRKFTEEELRKHALRAGRRRKVRHDTPGQGHGGRLRRQWLYFDYVPGEADIRRGEPIVTGRFCVIGSKINESALKELFGIE
jgi:hypothetical protein